MNNQSSQLLSNESNRSLESIISRSTTPERDAKSVGVIDLGRTTRALAVSVLFLSAVTNTVHHGFMPSESIENGSNLELRRNEKSRAITFAEARAKALASLARKGRLLADERKREVASITLYHDEVS